MTRSLRLWRAPGDGSCMFHAVGRHTGHSVEALRTLSSNLVRQRAHHDMNGMQLEQWIQFETGLDVDAYARAIHSHMWGGLLELTLLAEELQRPIVVYAAPGDVSRRTTAHKIMTIDAPFTSEQCPQPIYLLYSHGGNHYDALVERV